MTAYRRLDKAIKQKILIVGIAFVVIIWSVWVFTNSWLFTNINEIMLIIAIGFTITFFLFLYNTTSRGEYYLNRAKELGKKNI
jgi:predicted tellurium resistance membrane protein TerC